jgi:hypothetical protein
MKKILSQTLCLLALPAAASAQVELIAGWNFGQFISSGVPSTDGTTGDPVGFIPSNFTGASRPPPGSSGPEHINAGISSTFSLGSGIISWNGSNGSDAWDFTTGNAAAVNNFPEEYSVINTELVTGNDFNGGQIANYQLQFTAGAANEFSITANTAAFGDFNPAAFSQNNDFNFTFAAFGTGTVAFFYNNTQVGSTFTLTGDETAYNLDLPQAFYGNSVASLIGVVTGTVNLDNVQINGVAIPEPSSYVALAGLAGLAFVAGRRRR